MENLVKHIAGDFRSWTLTLFVLLALIAIVGVVPLGLGPDLVYELTIPNRILIGLVAVLIWGIPAFQAYLEGKRATQAGDEEYEKAWTAAQKKIQKTIPKDQVLAEANCGDVRFAAYNTDILSGEYDVLVSSDDSKFQAKGGVAKVILEKAGDDVWSELHHYRDASFRFRQGDIAITTGGRTGARAIIHPVVIDFKDNRYPDVSVIAKLVERSLVCAAAMGAESIAFPVLGGGTGSEGSKYLTPWDSVKTIVSTVSDYLRRSVDTGNVQLKYVALVVWDLEVIVKAGGDIPSLVEESFAWGANRHPY